MKLHNLNEARDTRNVEAKQKGPNTMPRLQRQGDFVWFLHKYFEQRNVNVSERKNPKLSKAQKEIAFKGFDDMKAKYAGKNTVTGKIWAATTDVNRKNWATEFLRFPTYASLSDFGDLWATAVLSPQELKTYNRLKGKDFWQKTAAERAKYDKWRNRIIAAKSKIGDELQEYTQRIYNEAKNRLPQKSFPSAVEAIYFPPRDMILMYNDPERDESHRGHPVISIKARHDKDGKITSSRIFLYGDQSIVVKNIQDIPPGELKDMFHFYKRHNDEAS